MMLIWTLLACRMSSPFEGPGFDDDGNFIAEPEAPVVVALTYGRPARGEAAAFEDHVGAILEQLEETDGVYGWSLRGELGGRERWTMTLWESEAAMMDFVLSGNHLEAMAYDPVLFEDGEFAHWEEADPSALPPTWSDATARLDE
jgi:heme-degrading monooxygenase HmoA